MCAEAFEFPFSFLWGAATSSHQVEGYNTANDWWAWEQEGKVGETSGAACDQYRLFSEDFRLAADLGHNAHRFSLEWSRLEPSEGEWSAEAFDHYTRVFKALREQKLEPVVCLHHFTNPLWLSRKGGWLLAEAPFYFGRFVQKAVEAFGEYASVWITFNEPVIYLYHGYITGLWPPGHRSVEEAVRVFRNLVEGHMEAYGIIHRHYARCMKRPVWVSIAKHMTALTPARPGNLLDRMTVFFRDWFFNHLMFRSLISGFLFFPGIYCERLKAQRTLDFLGVNYYTRNFIRFAGVGKEKIIGEVCEAETISPGAEKNSLGWEVCSEGFGRVLKGLGIYRLPVMVLENGICTAEDKQRARFIKRHLESFRAVRNSGIPLRGYFYWSLLDNFEWADGYGPRFGIIETDYASQQRKIRPSAYVLSESCRKLVTENDRSWKGEV